MARPLSILSKITTWQDHKDGMTKYARMGRSKRGRTYYIAEVHLFYCKLPRKWLEVYLTETDVQNIDLSMLKPMFSK